MAKFTGHIVITQNEIYVPKKNAVTINDSLAAINTRNDKITAMVQAFKETALTTTNQTDLDQALNKIEGHIQGAKDAQSLSLTDHETLSRIINSVFLTANARLKILKKQFD